MSAVTNVVLTGGIVAAGSVIEGELPDFKIVGGIVIAATFLTILENANAGLANGFGLLMVVGASFRYLPAIVESLGYGK